MTTINVQELEAELAHMLQQREKLNVDLASLDEDIRRREQLVELVRDHVSRTSIASSPSEDASRPDFARLSLGDAIRSVLENRGHGDAMELGRIADDVQQHRYPFRTADYVGSVSAALSKLTRNGKVGQPWLTKNKPGKETAKKPGKKPASKTNRKGK